MKNEAHGVPSQNEQKLRWFCTANVSKTPAYPSKGRAPARSKYAAHAAPSPHLPAGGELPGIKSARLVGMSQWGSGKKCEICGSILNEKLGYKMLMGGAQ